MWGTIIAIVGYGLADTLKEAIQQNKPEQIASIITQMSEQALAKGDQKLNQLLEALNQLNINSYSRAASDVISRYQAKLREKKESLENDLANAKVVVNKAQSYATQAYGDNSILGLKREKLASRAASEVGGAIRSLENELASLNSKDSKNK